MHSTRFIASLCAITLSALCASASAADAGMVKSAVGDVRVERAGRSLPLKAGDAVQEQDRIIVPVQGSAGITLKDDTLIGMGPKSTLVIDRYTFDSKTQQGGMQASIISGAMRFVTGLIAKSNARNVQFQVATATIGVRGTDFIIEAGDEK